MKNIFKSLMLVAVAAMGIACQENIEENYAPINPNEVVMTINADMDETRTYIDEANSCVQWSEGDQLKVIENSATYRTTTKTTIEDGKAKFTVAFPANTSASEFTYNALFPAMAVVEDDAEKINPAKVKVVVMEAQKPTATSFDPQADILVANQVVAEAQPTELNMQFKRLVAMGKMTLKGLPTDATISQVVFTAGASDVLAGRNYVNATTGKVSEYGYYGKTNTITLNYAEVISSRDIYFISNPFTMEAGEVFTVKVVCNDATYTREVSIPEGRSLTFTEGNLATFSVDMTTADKEANFVFADGDYAVLAVADNKYYALLCDANGSRLSSLDDYEYDGSGTITLTEDTANMRWTVNKTDNGYTFKGANNGYIAWYDNGNYAKTQTDPYYLDIVEDEKNLGRYFVVSKENAARKLQRNGDVTKYKYFAFYTSDQLGSLLLVPIVENTLPYFTIEQDVMSYTYDGDVIEFEVVSHNDFNAEVTATTDAEWISFEYEAPYIYATGAPNDGAAREAVITFSAEGYPSVKITVAQDAAPGADEDETMTIAKFLEEKDTETEYTLTGKITNVANTTYGNFDLTDATGTIYVYGLLTPDGQEQRQWAAAGLKEGDTITIRGKYSVYKDSPQIKNAVYVSHKSINVDNESLKFTAQGGSMDITATLVNAADAISVSVDNSHFTVALKSGTTYTVTAPANETEETIYANLTFTAGELSAVVALSQEPKPVEGDVVGGRDDFSTVSANSSYGTRTTTNGWKGTNCAVMQGGSSDNNPTFTFIGSTSAIRAFTINGKTSAKGVITSPTLTTGCGKLSLKYGHAFSESNGVDFTITIKQNGTAVNTYRVDVNSITQKKAYTWEQDVNIAGDFVIEITNNSPSNSTSNKDRVSIWDIEWTGYAE
ncbi:MAG: BACON domain-containing protein [Alistipes sp.]|nr:BACON domain-containing protein [Alistipes sp.]MBR4046039.1 BACON domain-containing protein [Alistipes sp.]